MNIVARIARCLGKAERSAMLWLTQYARMLDLTADMLSVELDMDRSEIRASLTDPEFDRSRFVRHVSALRAKFEAGLQVPRFERTDIPPFKSRVFREAYCEIADTKVRRKIANAFNFAENSATGAQIVEVIGETRLGKDTAAFHEFARRLDHAAWLVTPSPGDERSWLHSVAIALGCSVGNSEKVSGLTAKIESCIGPNRISTMVVTEAHRLFPSDLKNKPKRLDHLRDWWEYHGLNIVLLATPQFTERLNAAINSETIPWETGQWIGRVQVFDLPSGLDDKDLRAIALNHAPEASDEIVEQLVSHAKSSKGYAGAMVKAIERARFRQGGITLANIKTAQTQNDREARLQILSGRGA